jgi:tRNA wybutosine-synthesizing protein 1
MDPGVRKVLVNQQYLFVGKQTAVKTCRWTKNSIRNEGHCYKQQFYGIESHRCVQMSPTVGYCQNRCIFCWRPIELTIGDRMDEYDDPKDLINLCVKAQRTLLSGFGGSDKADRKKIIEARTPRHFAISLSGEPLLYPVLSRFIRLLRSGGYSSFVVTNGMEPVLLSKLYPPTQLYLSVDAPNELLFRMIDCSTVPDGWERLMKSLDVIRKKKTRTSLRFTLIKGYNMVKPKQWAQLIDRSQPWFVEIKAYMHVGFSKERLKHENMPTHAEVKAFAKKIERYSSYRVIDEHPRSRVVLLSDQHADDRMIQEKI